MFSRYFLIRNNDFQRGEDMLQNQQNGLVEVTMWVSPSEIPKESCEQEQVQDKS